MNTLSNQITKLETLFANSHWAPNCPAIVAKDALMKAVRTRLDPLETDDPRYAGLAAAYDHIAGMCFNYSS